MMKEARNKWQRRPLATLRAALRCLFTSHELRFPGDARLARGQARALRPSFLNLRVPLALCVVLTLTACAGSATRAPIEARDGQPSAAASADEPAVPAATRQPPTVIATPIDLPEPAVPVPVPEEFEDDEVEGSASEQLALAHPPAPREPSRNPAAQSLLDAATQAAARGEWERAQAALERAVKVAPDDAALWRQLAYTQYRRGEFNQALEIAQRALRVDPTPPAAAASWRLIAEIESARGNASAASAARAKSLQR
jgi:tetratricopeptide (TPR) repeat protein